MVVVGGRRVEQTQDFGICRFVEGLHIFGEVFVDLVPKVAQILPKVAPTLGFLVLVGWTYRALPMGPIGPL